MRFLEFCFVCTRLLNHRQIGRPIAPNLPYYGISVLSQPAAETVKKLSAAAAKALETLIDVADALWSLYCTEYFWLSILHPNDMTVFSVFGPKHAKGMLDYIHIKQPHLGLKDLKEWILNLEWCNCTCNIFNCTFSQVCPFNHSNLAVNQKCDKMQGNQCLDENKGFTIQGITV